MAGQASRKARHHTGGGETMSKCKLCGKTLKTPESIKSGYGPICKVKQDAADAEFLKLQVTIDEEIEYQERVAR